MKEKRNTELLIVGYFLSRFGRDPRPPTQLGVRSWNAAYALFHPRLHGGRTLQAFRNSLRNIRDQFDGYHDTGRVGWRQIAGSSTETRPPILLADDAYQTLERWQNRSESEVWDAVKPYADFNTKGQSDSVIERLGMQDVVGENDQVSRSVMNSTASKGRGESAITSATPAVQNAPAEGARVVTAAQLSEWRRSLIRLLKSVDAGQNSASTDGPAERIHRLSRDGVIPREVAALMRLVTEMRNSTEYQSKVLSVSESAAVRSAWTAICEWADTQSSRQ